MPYSIEIYFYIINLCAKISFFSAKYHSIWKFLPKTFSHIRKAAYQSCHPSDNICLVLKYLFQRKKTLNPRTHARNWGDVFYEEFLKQRAWYHIRRDWFWGLNRRVNKVFLCYDNMILLIGLFGCCALGIVTQLIIQLREEIRSGHRL